MKDVDIVDFDFIFVVHRSSFVVLCFCLLLMLVVLKG